MEGWFKAVNAHTGEVLWKYKTDSGIIGQPVSYRGPDKQVIPSPFYDPRIFCLPLLNLVGATLYATLRPRPPRPMTWLQTVPFGGIVMAIARYEPWTVVSQLQNEINRVFGNLNDTESSSATADWMPAVDVREYQNRFELLVDVPGVDPKQVVITLDNGVLTLSGERRDERAVESDGKDQLMQQRSERRLGRFHRRFILPDTADAEKVTASGRDGVLAISIAKHPKAQPRRISVS